MATTTRATDRGAAYFPQLSAERLDIAPLSEELRIDRSVMVGVCDDLEREGHVRRERNPRDRRSYAVTITDSGRRRLAAAQASIPAFLDDTFHALTGDERRRLSAILAKLLGR
ncbi:MarR family transcriptional regulator [Nonomuraea sp. JJY05]|jgi:DNA-binding MarR family transcriptional regulator|uniref:MarR family transcriptional regulator n=1 Tax=Nonomuraea sp. JJY05 TaxID=3350255 RepID=UPI00373F5C86